MKKIIFASVTFSLVFSISGCSIFKKKDKYGCPNDARNMTEEQINAKANKRKYKAGKF